MSLLSIYREGYDAFLAGKTKCANPYVGYQAEAWNEGWTDAEYDNRK